MAGYSAGRVRRVLGRVLQPMLHRVSRQAAAGMLFISSPAALAAGAVVGEPGSCIMEIGIYTAHFTVYQPETSGNEEFCEDLPDTGATLFVLDYLHGSLAEVPVAFRIIRDAEDWGIFARWENVAGIEDIDARTVFHRPGEATGAERLEAEHDFLEAGAYIGIVTAPHPEKDLVYHAVFPFQVAQFNAMPWLLALAAAAAFVWRRRRKRVVIPAQAGIQKTGRDG